MTRLQTTRYYYPNHMGRIVILAMEEILGSNGLNTVLNVAGLAHLVDHLPASNFNLQFPFEQIADLQAGLETAYGPLSGRGLARRAGRVSFKYGLREMGELMGLSDTAFRLLPLHEKISRGVVIFAETFNRFSDQRVRVVEDEHTIYWHIDRCPVCWGRQTGHPVCHLAVGILEEGLYWVSGGKQYRVEETHCISRGDPTCTIEIDKQAFE